MGCLIIRNLNWAFRGRRPLEALMEWVYHHSPLQSQEGVSVDFEIQWKNKEWGKKQSSKAIALSSFTKFLFSCRFPIQAQFQWI
ncbi:hypothetical protein VNO77_17553 [Canavalia gladiata]|uniref:Uncharacterized protein n=1 Tax=Canavalia gladiata TaxID=3824 RepID=A0AAN9LMZ3_CANGL